MQKTMAFFQTCIDELRPAGWFNSRLFDNLDAVQKAFSSGLFDPEDIEEMESDTDWFEEMEPYLFSGLLALDQEHCAHINIKKAGAEGGRGYYQQMIQQLVGCFADDVEVTEDWLPNKEGWADIVPVNVKASIKQRWKRPSQSEAIVSVRQAFAPVRSWTDMIFLEQLLHTLLGESSRKIRHRTGIDEEWDLLIFSPSDQADDALAAFERSRFGGAEGSRKWTFEIDVMDQPTAENISEIWDQWSGVENDDDDNGTMIDQFSDKSGRETQMKILGLDLGYWGTIVLVAIPVIYFAFLR